MQVVDHIGLPPGMCFICEATPTEAQTVIDTKRDFEPGGPTYINGRKYICESCAHECAKLYDFVSKKSVEDVHVANEWLRARVSELEDRARQVAEQILGNAEIDVRVIEPKPLPKKVKKVVDEA